MLSIAGSIRNKFTAHYDLDHAVEIISLINDEDEFAILLQEIVGNTRYDIGDTILLGGLLSKEPKLYEQFLKWNQAAISTIQNFHQAFVVAVYDEYFPDKQGSEFILELEDERDFIEPGTTVTPLFYNPKANP